MIAAITAGGRVDGALAAAIGTSVKALASVGGRTLLDVAVAAARDAGAARIVVIGGPEVRAHCAGRVDEIVDESPDGRENIRRAILRGNAQALLLLTSDLPFVAASDVRAFVDAARSFDLALPLASARDYEAAYPGAPPHVTRIGNERVANGSIVYFAPEVALRVLASAQRVFDARKSLVRMAALLGPGLFLRFATGTLRIAHVEARAERVLGVRARAVRDASPGLCFDVDSLDDYAYAIAHAAPA